jgi:hypothetical protein
MKVLANSCFVLFENSDVPLSTVKLGRLSKGWKEEMLYTSECFRHSDKAPGKKNCAFSLLSPGVRYSQGSYISFITRLNSTFNTSFTLMRPCNFSGAASLKSEKLTGCVPFNNMVFLSSVMQ